MNYDNYELELISSLLTSDHTPDFIEVVDKIESGMFQNGSFRSMYMAIQELYKKGADTDVFTVSDKTGIDTGGMIEMVKSSVGNSKRLKSFAKRVRQGYYLRTARNEFTRVIAAIDSCVDESEIGVIAEMVEKAVTNLVVETDKKKPVIASQLADSYIDVLQDRYDGGESDRRLKFGIDAIDDMTGGLNPTDLLVLGGCPGMGKTELMVTLSNACSDEKGGALNFSLEMSETELIERSIAIESGISITDLRNPRNLDDEGFARVSEGIGRVSDKHFHVLDLAGLSINEIIAQAIEHKSRHPSTKLITVDYAGLVDMTHYQDTVRGLGDVGKKLKELAKKIQTPVVLLSQVVSKSIEQRADKRPMASDLKGSSELQDAADWIVFPYRDVVYNEDSISKDIAEVVFAKARHGKQGSSYMGWMKGHFVPTDQAQAQSTVRTAKTPVRPSMAF